MTIHLPPDIESSIQAAVHSGQFASRRRRHDRSRVPARSTAQAGAGPSGPGGSNRPMPQTRKPIWERILERTAAIPDEEWDNLPTDLAEQHDHYIYGTPKRPTA